MRDGDDAVDSNFVRNPNAPHINLQNVSYIKFIAYIL